MQLEKVEAYNSELAKRRQCAGCPMAGRKFVGVDTCDGIVHPVSVMFLGLNPGVEEAATGLPFVGKAGRFLRQEIKEADVTSWMMANSILCSTPNEAAINDANGARRACHANLGTIFRDFAPKIIVPLGNGAWSIFDTGIPISRAQGAVFSSRGKSGNARDTLVLPLLHPSAMIRNGGRKSAQYPLFRQRLEEIARLSKMDNPLASLRESGVNVKECFQ